MMDKMREEFEAWFKCEFGYTPARSELNMDDYSTTASSTSWLAWKASRAALRVELPSAWNRDQSEFKSEVYDELDSVGVSYK